MRTLLNWLRSWRQPKSCKSDEPTSPCSLRPENARESQGMNDCHKIHHPMDSPACALPSDHYHHHDLRLLKGCRVMPLPTTVDEDDLDYSDNNNVEFDDEDADIEFSTMMRASFATMTPPYYSEEDEHLSFSMPIPMPDRAMSMQHSMSMPKLYTPQSPPPAAAKVQVRFIEDTFTARSLPNQRSPSANAKKVPRMKPSLLLRVMRRPRLPRSPSTTAAEGQPLPHSPSTNAASALFSCVRAPDPPSTIPQSPLTRMKRSLKSPRSPLNREMAYAATTQTHSPQTQTMDMHLKSPPPKARKSINGLPSPPMYTTSAGLKLASDKAERALALTYQPLCCSSGTCILECHVVDTSSKKDILNNKNPQLKKPTMYGMTLLPSVEGKVRHVRRISFKNGRWITDDSDYVVLEL